MSFVENYRSRLATRQKRGLMLYLFLAVAAHTVGLGFWQPQQLVQPTQPEDQPTPVEFVYVEPDSTQPPPQQTNQRAQSNANANRDLNANLPPQPGRKSARPATTPPSAAAIPLSPQPAISAAQSAFPEPAPQSITPPSPHPISAAPEPDRLPSPIPDAPAPAAAERSSTPPLTSPQLPLPPTPSAAAQLGDPLTASATIEGQGLSGQLNSNRMGNGSSVDALRDDQWGDYLSGLNQSIDQKWQNVLVTAVRRTRIQFRVDRQGNLTQWRLVQPSGDTLADEAAIQAVRTAAPFAPLPQNAPEDLLIVNFTFTQWPASEVP